jgi:type 1 fimbria pilin
VRTLLCVAIVAVVTAFASAQTVEAPKVNFLADVATPDGDTVTLHGHVRIAACSIVTADEGVLDLGKYEANLSGNVHMKLTDGVDPLKVVK